MMTTVNNLYRLWLPVKLTSYADYEDAPTDIEDEIEPPVSQSGPSRTLSMEQHDLCLEEMSKLREKVI